MSGLSPRGRAVVGARPGVFKSHRAARVKVLLMLGCGMLVALGVVNGALSSPSAGGEATPTESVSAEAQPKLDVGRADPMRKTVDVVPADVRSTQRYTSLVSAASDAAKAVGTFSAGQSPEQYVEAVPGLSDEGRAALLVSAKGMWEQLKSTRVGVVGSVSADPVVVRFAEDGLSATVRVLVDQQITQASGAVSRDTRLYTVEAVGAVAEGQLQDVVWKVTSVTSG